MVKKISTTYNLIVRLALHMLLHKLLQIAIDDLNLEIFLIMLLLSRTKRVNSVKQAFKLISHNVSLHELNLDLLLKVSYKVGLALIFNLLIL
jgi:hypothetical protein